MRDISSPAKRGLLPKDREVKCINGNNFFLIFVLIYTSPVATIVSLNIIYKKYETLIVTVKMMEKYWPDEKNGH